ncbi:hypothetical protein QTP88_010042 [Uroleucon formosanum]
MEDMRHEAIEDTIKNFTRMTTIEFEHLKSLIEAQVKKIDTQFREAISVTERLAITLRFLATGDLYTSLQYLFRVSKQSISRIVPEVCDALLYISELISFHASSLTVLLCRLYCHKVVSKAVLETFSGSKNGNPKKYFK